MPRAVRSAPGPVGGEGEMRRDFAASEESTDLGGRVNGSRKADDIAYELEERAYR